jgi:hypothetical protein
MVTIIQGYVKGLFLIPSFLGEFPKKKPKLCGVLWTLDF